LEIITLRLALAGFALFSIGLVTGQQLPRPEGKPYFSDPKVVWSALLWLVYLELIIARLFFGRSTRRFTIGVIVAFAFLLLTFGITNHYSSLHN
jgi:ABC-type transport system involved in cytochrome c biogenesis permease subunit